MSHVEAVFVSIDQLSFDSEQNEPKLAYPLTESARLILKTMAEEGHARTDSESGFVGIGRSSALYA